MAKSIKNYEKKYTALEEVVKKLDDESLFIQKLLSFKELRILC